MTYAGSPLVALLVSWQDDARDLLPPLRPQLHPEGVLPSHELAARAAAIRRLRRTVIPREARKQRYLWPAMRKYLFADAPRMPSGDAVVVQLLDRKRLFEQELIRLRWSDERSTQFERQLGVLIDQIQSYIDCQEAQLPRIATQIPGGEQERLCERLTEQRALVPVQPHPDLPAVPWIAAATAPVAAVLDRLRDWLSTAPG